MTTALATSSVVESVVDGLEAIGAAAAQVGADADGLGAGVAPRLLAGEESEHTVTQRDAHAVESGAHLVVVAAGGVGNRATESTWPAVPWTTTHLVRESVAPAVRVEGIVDCDLSLGLGDSDLLVANHGRDSRLAITGVHGPVQVRHAQSSRGIPPSLLLVRREVIDDLSNREIPGLLLIVSLPFQPRTI